jgi:hypothetical protein
LHSGRNAVNAAGLPFHRCDKPARDNPTHDDFCNDDLPHSLIFIKSARRMIRALSWIECASGVCNGFNDNQAVL